MNGQYIRISILIEENKRGITLIIGSYALQKSVDKTNSFAYNKCMGIR